MLKLFKKHFIPHEGNDHQPHFLRIKNIRTIIAIVFVVELGVLTIPFLPALNPANNNFMASVLPAVLDDLTNQKREAQNLPALTVNPILNRVAEMKAKDMAEKSYFAHVSPEGKQPWYWFNLAGYKYEYAGENLAINFTDSQDVTNAWMNSPTHRANIVKNAYTEIGTGIATGTYQGYPTIFVAQVFGKPAKAIVAVEEKLVTNIVIAQNTKKEASAPNVMGASAKEVSVPVTKNISATPTKAVGATVATPVETPSVPALTYTKANIFQKYATSPRHIANIIFLVLAIIILLALILKLFIKMDKVHSVLITNGLVVLVIIFGFYTTNNFIANSKTLATTSFVSFQGEVIDFIK